MSFEDRILIAGVGNELRQDDAFGIEFVRHWNKSVTAYDHIVTMEVGIAGIHLVQELHAGYDMMILVDAIDYKRTPGSISIEELEKLADITKMPLDEKREFLADMHYTNPTRAMMLAQALNVLPPKVYILGGGKIYAESIALADEMILTEIHGTFNGDTFFPEIDLSIWKEIKRENCSADVENRYDYSFVWYGRRD